MQNQGFTEKEQITDLLSAEKFLASNYNAFLVESATPEVVRCLSSLLDDTHRMQQTVFHEMQQKGWYPVTKAEDTKVNQTKAKFEASIGN
ncbi:MAG: spore coat protein [Clostridia bacterium]|nr:spore coat protein [Clostridia bacterium]